jgi:hypothetical protein
MIAADADHRREKYSKRAAWRLEHLAASVRRAVARCIRTSGGSSSSSSSSSIRGGNSGSPVCPCAVPDSSCSGRSSGLLSLQSMSLALSLLALVLLYVVHVAGVEHMQKESHDMQEDVRQTRKRTAAAHRATPSAQ